MDQGGGLVGAAAGDREEASAIASAAPGRALRNVEHGTETGAFELIAKHGMSERRKLAVERSGVDPALRNE